MIRRLFNWLFGSGVQQEDREPTGRWVNRGTKQHEQWVWKEKPNKYKKSYICIHEIDGDYFISKRPSESLNAVECIECLSKKDEQRAVKLLQAGYQLKGELIVAVE